MLQCGLGNYDFPVRVQWQESQRIADMMETSLCLYPVLAVQEVYSSLVVARREVKTTRFWW